MGVRYRNEFTSNNGTDWKIDIHDDTYSSAVTSFTTESPGFTLTHPSEGTERQDPIKGSSLTVHGSSENAAFNTLISNIIGAQEERFSICLYKDGNLYWSGHILTDIIEQEDASQPFRIDLIATDSLKRLKEINYDNSGTLYTGFETFVGHVINILGKTNLSQFWGASDEFLRVAVDWWDDNHPAPATAKDPFVLSRVQHEVFYLQDENKDNIANNCFDVLDQILRAWYCRLVLSNGIWQIIQIPQYNGTTTATRSYKKDGTSHSTAAATDYRVTVDQSNVAKLATGTSTFLPALNKVKQVYNHGENSTNLLPNTITDNTTYQIGLFPSGTGNKLMLFGKIIAKHTKVENDPTVWHGKLSITMILDLATDKYAVRSGLGDGLGWTTSASTVDVWLGPVLEEFDGHQETIALAISFITADIPNTANLSFKIALADFYDKGRQNVVTSDFTTEPTLDYSELQMTFIEGDELKDKEEFAIDNNTGSTPTNSKLVLELPDTLIGDGPTAVARGHIEASDGAGSPTWADSTAWDKNGNADNLNFNNLKIQEILAGQKTPKEVMQARITGNFDFVSRLTYDSKAWVMRGGTLTAEMDVWQGEWFELGRVTSNQTIKPIKNLVLTLPEDVSSGQLSRELIRVVDDAFTKDEGTIAGFTVASDKIGTVSEGVVMDSTDKTAYAEKFVYKVNSANVSNPPTAAELDSIFTSKAAFGDGNSAMVQDSDSNNLYLVFTDLTKWYTIAGVTSV